MWFLLESLKQWLILAQDHALHWLHIRVCCLHLAVLECPRELELRWLSVELVDYGAYVVAGDSVSIRVSAHSQRTGEGGGQSWQEEDVKVIS